MYKDVLLFENPKRRRHSRRRNPVASSVMPKSIGKYFQGIDLVDAAAATGGLAVTTLVPGMVIKDTSTAWMKIAKLLVAAAGAVAAGMLASNLKASAGKAALIGGLAGVGSQALSMFTNVKIGSPVKQLGGSGVRRISDNTNVPPVFSRDAEKVSVIMP